MKQWGVPGVSLPRNAPEKLTKAQDLMKKRLFDATGMRFREASSRGTTGTGNQAKRFFSREVIDVMEGLLEEKRVPHAGIIIQIHRNLSVIFGVIATSSKVDCDKLEELCKQTYTDILTTYPWVLITAIHEVLAHSFQVIRLNDGLGMGNWSEQPTECE